MFDALVNYLCILCNISHKLFIMSKCRGDLASMIDHSNRNLLLEGPYRIKPIRCYYSNQPHIILLSDKESDVVVCHNSELGPTSCSWSSTV